MEKSRYWEGILYPESMVPGWEDIIGTELEYPYCYCIHDKDYDKNGELMKTHVHVILAYPSPTTGKQVMKLFNRLTAPGHDCCCNRIQDKYNIRSAYDYLIHDTEESKKAGKFQYDKKCRIEGNHFDIGLYENVSLSEKDEMCEELCRFIIKNEITNYADFYTMVSEKYTKEYLRIIKSYSGHLDRLIRGVYNKKKNEKESAEKEYKAKNVRKLVNDIERKDMIINAQKEYIDQLKLKL